MDLATLRRKIELLDREIRPIANRPIAFGTDILKNWTPPPNSVAAQKTLSAAIDLYLRCSAEERQQIRDIFRDNRSFAWAAALPFRPDNAERLRRHLAHFSILDQYPDSRDAILWLNDLRASPFYNEVRDEIAALSSEATKKLLSAR